MKRIILMIILSMVNVDSYAAEKILICDNCSRSEINSEIKKLTKNKKYYVIDNDSETISLYYYFSDWEFPDTVSKLSVPSNVKSDFNAWIDAKNDANNWIDNNFPELSSSLLKDKGNEVLDPNRIMPIDNKENDYTELYVDNYTDSYRAQAFDNPPTKNCSVGGINVYDFIESSAVRRSEYERTHSQYPIFSFLKTRWDAFHLGTEVGFGNILVVKASDNFLIDPVRHYFSNGSSVRVIFNEMEDTFNVVDKTGIDCGGNTVPDKSEDIEDEGKYIYIRDLGGRNEGAENMTNRIENFGIRVGNEGICHLDRAEVVCTQVVESGGTSWTRCRIMKMCE